MEFLCVPGTEWITRSHGGLSRSSHLEVEEEGGERVDVHKPIITRRCRDYGMIKFLQAIEIW